MKVLICGDVHLTNYSNFNRATGNPETGSRLGYILKALDYFFDYGQKNNIHTFIINGDLFDQRQRDNPTTLSRIQERIITKYRSIYGDNNFLYLNIGNHDELTRDIEPNSLMNFPLYSTDSHFVQVMHDVTLIGAYDHELLFVPYSENVQEIKDKIKQTLSNDLEKLPISVFAHLGVDGATQGRWDHRLSDAFNLNNLGWNDKRVKSITLSHFHTRQSLKKEDNKEAYYIGDLTELNFNDIQKNGYGAPRGFEVLDTQTGEHHLVDLTKEPYNIPTFNSFNLDKDKIDVDKLSKLSQDNYVRLVTSNQDTYDLLNDKLPKNNVQLVFNPKDEEHEELDIDPDTTDKELVAKYCEQHYPEVKDQALEYLRKAKEN